MISLNMSSLNISPSLEQIKYKQELSNFLNLKAKKQANLIFNYKNNEILRNPLVIQNSPMIPNSNPIKYFDNDEWENEIIKELNLLEDKSRLLKKLNKIMNLN